MAVAAEAAVRARIGFGCALEEGDGGLAEGVEDVGGGDARPERLEVNDPLLPIPLLRPPCASGALRLRFGGVFVLVAPTAPTSRKEGGGVIGWHGNDGGQGDGGAGIYR